MFFAVFRKFFVLFFCVLFVCYGQIADNVASIELGQTNFSIERPFTITVTVSNSETRPVLVFPDLAGFSKKGTSASVSISEISGKTITNQVISQSYQALAPGRFRMPPFEIMVNGKSIKSEGIVLVVRASATAAPPASVSALAAPPGGAAFLTIQASKPTIYVGEGVALTLSFFVADNYPYELNFTALDRQLQAITKKIRPANAWEENRPINDLKPVSVVIGGKKFRDYKLYQSVFFPLSNQPVRIPAVSLWLGRPRPVVGPPSAQPETVVFTSRPITINVRPLPPHPLRGQVPVGVFRLEETTDRQRVKVGQSVRYTFAVTGEGNIAALPAPVMIQDSTAADVFPPNEHHTVHNEGSQVTGRKTFTYFVVPHQNGAISLANRFQWIYFNLHTARYDTLRPRLQLQVGSGTTVAADNTPAAAGGTQTNDETVQPLPTRDSLYAGLEAMDSSYQPISIPVLIRTIANVLIVLMLLGMIFVFFRK